MRNILALGLLMVSTGVMAAHPGKVDFDRLVDLDRADVVAQVNLSGWLMNILQAAADDAEDAAVLAGIDEITVRVLDVNRDPRRYRNLAESLHADLTDQGWDNIAQVNDNGDVVHVMVKGDASVLEGFTVMVVDDDGEAVFVNMAGAINPRDIARLMRNVHIDGHDDIELDFDW